MSYKMISPISTSRHALQVNQISKEDLSRRNREEVKTYRGKVIGVSSPDEGFLGSSHDKARDFLKFRVFFEDEKRIEMVTPNITKEEAYEKIGYCEENYLGLNLTCKYRGDFLPKDIKEGLRGVLDIGDVKGERVARNKIEVEEPQVNVNSQIYKTEENPLEESMGFFSGGFSGIIDGANSFLMGKLYS